MMKLTLSVIVFGACLMAQTPSEEETYGLKPGAVGGSISAGGLYISGRTDGMSPAVAGGVEYGLRKYVGIFGEGGWSHRRKVDSACDRYICATLEGVGNYYQVGGGIQFMATNKTRFVPYAKVGMGYVGQDTRLTFSGGISDTAVGTTSAPAALVAGGFRTYLSRNVGIDVQVRGLYTLGDYRGGRTTLIAPTVGLFFHSK